MNSLKLTMPKVAKSLLLATVLTSSLVACVPAVVGGAAAGGAVAVDRRTAGIYIEDERDFIWHQKSCQPKE